MKVSDATNNEVIARLDKLERENKILKRVGAITILIGGALLIMAQAPARPRTIEAERLIIRYPNGKEAIVLGTADAAGDKKAGGAEATFYRPDHSIGAVIKVAPDVAWVQVNSPKNGLEVEMHASGDPIETAGLAIYKASFPLLSMLANTKGESNYSLVTDFGPMLRLMNGPEGASVELYDDPNKLRAVLGRVSIEAARTGSVEARSLSSLVLFDKDGKVLWRAP